MALSRAEAEQHGLAFNHEDDYRAASSPDQPHFAADLTIDGHTEHIQGKSEEDVLAQAERLLLSRGAIQRDDPVAESSPLPTQVEDLPAQDAETPDSDVHDERNANDDAEQPS